THILVASLTGVVTSEGKGKRCGDASLEGRNRRLLQLSHPALKPKGLASDGRAARLDIGASVDKNVLALSGK
ncbi:MAG TPA: hypothetical protein VM095_01525, partial [Pyrinomonadaceae bacterium]|nr:hypothetical protein [Pyrinomonadaceae bacterium]